MIGRFLIRPSSQLAAAVLLSLLVAVMNCTMFFVFLLGWGVEPSVALGCALLVPAVMEIAMLPISVAGWGVREGTAIVAFSAVGLPAATAFGSSVLYALTVLAVSLIGGALWMIDRRDVGGLAVVQKQSHAAVEVEERLAADAGAAT
jgi:hypothetical protein